MYEISATRHEPKARASFEIHRRTDSRWEFKAARSDMEAAIDEAHRVLAQPGTQAVRIVHDLYDPVSGSVKPTAVFRATAPVGVVRALGFWARWRAQRAARPAPPPGQFRRDMMARLAVSLLAIALGTLTTWLRS